MIGKAKVQISNVWTSQSSRFQSLEKTKFKILIFGKAKIQNSSAWKSQNSEFLCLEKQKIKNSNV